MQIEQMPPSFSLYSAQKANTQDLEKYQVVGRLLENLPIQLPDQLPESPTDSTLTETSSAPFAPVDLLADPLPTITHSKGRALKEVPFTEWPEPDTEQTEETGLGPSAAALESGRPPGQRGPFQVNKIKMTLADQQVDVYLPVGKGPFPVNVYATGLSHTQRHAKANANHFASWGMVTIVPSLGGNLNPVNSGQSIEKILSDLSQRKKLQGTQIDPNLIAVSGHSFGGLTATLAADHPAVKALLALDPNDNLLQMNPGRRQASQVQVPAAFIFGDGGPNNLGPGIYHELASPQKYAFELKDMPHLNFVSSSEWPNQPGQERALDFATAFLLHELGGLSATQPYLADGKETKAAMRSGELRQF
jgi:hypothetical protein